MRPRSVVLLVTTLLLVGFAALNWENLVAATPINFLFGTVEAPLGIVLLLVVSLMTLLFLGFVAFLEIRADRKSKRLEEDVLYWRNLAEKAEGSRIEELKSVIEAGFDDLYDRIQRPTDAGPRRQAALPESLAATESDDGNAPGDVAVDDTSGSGSAADDEIHTQRNL